MSADAIFELAMIQTYQDKTRGWNTLRDLVKAGDLDRVDRGKYRYVAGGKAPKKQTVMWRFLRMRRVVTVDDLVVASGASADYAREWLRGLIKKEVVKKRADGAFVLMHEIPAAEPPKDEEKAEKLREIRRRHKELSSAVVEALDMIHSDVCSLCGSLEDLISAVKSCGKQDL